MARSLRHEVPPNSLRLLATDGDGLCDHRTFVPHGLTTKSRRLGICLESYTSSHLVPIFCYLIHSNTRSWELCHAFLAAETVSWNKSFFPLSCFCQDLSQSSEKNNIMFCYKFRAVCKNKYKALRPILKHSVTFLE